MLIFQQAKNQGLVDRHLSNRALVKIKTASQDVVFFSVANLVPVRGDDPEKMHVHSRSPFYCEFDKVCKEQFAY
jgi:hypothetical protein